MRVMRDFLCTNCGQHTEKLVDSDYSTIECPECFHNATVQMSTPTIKLDGTSGDFPGAHDKWARIREDNARIKAARS